MVERYSINHVKSFKLVVNSILLNTKDYSHFTVNDSDMFQYNERFIIYYIHKLKYDLW